MPSISPAGQPCIVESVMLLHTLGEMASTSAAVRYLQRGRASSSSARHFCQISVPEASFRPSMKRSIFSLLMPARS